MKEIKAFETTNGEMFKTREEAIERQNRIDFVNWYADNVLYGNYEGSYVSSGDMIAWLKDNKEMVLKLLR